MKTVQQKRRWLRMRADLVLSAILRLPIEGHYLKRSKLAARFDGIMGELKGIYWMSKKLNNGS